MDKKFETMAEVNLIVKPNGFTISNEVAKIHGIDQKLADDYGLDEGLVLVVFATLMKQAKCLIAHNIVFDGLVMGKAFAEHPQLTPQLPEAKFCTMNAMTDICKLYRGPGKFKWPTLQEAHLHAFGVGFEGAHDAIADVRACARIFRWLKEGAKPTQAADPLESPLPVAEQNCYEDDDKMPFGKHRGIPISDVPASYLHWLWGQRPMSDKKLEAYIRNNLSSLKQEHPDGIWS